MNPFIASKEFWLGVACALWFVAMVVVVGSSIAAVMG